jgi:hypothetical protein
MTVQDWGMTVETAEDWGIDSGRTGESTVEIEDLGIDCCGELGQ